MSQQPQQPQSPSSPLLPPPPPPPPPRNDGELATVREAQRSQCVRSPILDVLLRWVKPSTTTGTASSSSENNPTTSTTSTSTSTVPTRHFQVLRQAYPQHLREEERIDRQGKSRKKVLPVHFPDNTVSTAKYTVFTFIPRALFEQFRRLANVYFLIVTVLMMLGTYTDLYESPLTPYTTLFPLCVVLAITMGKEAFEDLKRHTADMKTNNRKAKVLNLTAPGQLDPVYWKDIRVGRIVQVQDREEIPADLLLLASSEPGGLCYVQTSNIDGETNLKLKQAAHIEKATNESNNNNSSSSSNGQQQQQQQQQPPLAFTTPTDLHNWDATLECEAPNSRIHTYTGTLTWQDRQIPVDQANLLLRGSTLRNSKWILGLVVYTGYETKIVMNSRAAPSKLSTIEMTTNRLLYLILATQVLLVTVTLGAYLVWTQGHESKLHYLCFDYLNSPRGFYRMNCQPSDDTSPLGMWVTFLLLYNNFVPISLYVTVEMVNYCQAFFIDQDREMYDEISDTPALARTSNMNGDLGSVKYVFSDKTGTLTQNVMRFRRCSVAGEVFGNLEGEEDGGGEGGGGSGSGGEGGQQQQIQGEEERGSGSTRGSGSGGATMGQKRKSLFAVQGLPLSELSARSMVGEKPSSSSSFLSSAAPTGTAASFSTSSLAARYFAEILSVCHTVVVETEQDETTTGSNDTDKGEGKGKDKTDNNNQQQQPHTHTHTHPSEIKYQAESPDEEALVDAAATELGWQFLGRTPTEAHILTPHNHKRTYKILAIIPFTSTRKRMSVVVRTPEGKVVLLTKGADNVLFARAKEVMGTTRQALDAHLSAFAADGLRTLVLGRKEVSEDEFQSWYVDWQKASAAVEGRGELVAGVAERMERGLVVVGATAIEDKLQEGVPATIAHLLEAGIKVWVLTGDKMETAINIGYSCRLLTSSMVLVRITEKGDGGGGGDGGGDGVGVGGGNAMAGSSSSSTNTSSPPGRERERQRQAQEAQQDAEEEAALRHQLRRLVTHFERLVEDTALSEGLFPHTAAAAAEGKWWQTKHKHRKSQRQSGLRRRSSFLPVVAVPCPLGEGTSTSILPQPLIPFPPPPSSPRGEAAAAAAADAASYLEDLQSDHLAVIIDGPALARIFGDGEMERLLLRVATLCKSVVACRVSPAQKRMLIRLVKKGVRRPTPITLAIGDGANDVAMIQEAQIGVGISGREGRQAVNSADFAIAQFRFLEPLLLKHGRWNYRRIALVILYSFYKNIVLTFILFFYTWCAGFSGQPLFEDLTYSAFNFFLAMPIICVGFFDRDLEWGTITGGGRGGGGNRHRHTHTHTHTKGEGNGAATTSSSSNDNGGGRSFRWAYMSGRENLDLNLGKMTLWLVQAVLDSVLIFCFSFGAINAPRQVVSGQGDADDLYLLGLLAYTGMLLATLYKTASNTYTWTWVNGFFFVGSLLLYLIYLFVYGAMPVFAGGFYGTPYIMFTRAFFWLVAVVLVPAISVVVDYTFIYLRLAFFPSPVDIAVEVDRGYGPLVGGEEEEGEEEEERVRLKKAEEEEEGIEEGVGGGGEEEDEEEGRRSGWYPGKLLVSLDLLRRLNRLVTQKEKEEMGISDHAPGVLASSYDYTSTSMDLGPGGGER